MGRSTPYRTLGMAEESPMTRQKKPYAITRLQKTKNASCWKVGFSRRLTYGGAAKALDAAIAWRDAIMVLESAGPSGLRLRHAGTCSSSWRIGLTCYERTAKRSLAK